MELYKGRYRTSSTRLNGWDYTTPGYYFITFCTKNHEKFFGQVIKGDMQLSPVGEIAQRFWLDIPTHFPNSSLDEFVIMPNHFHGIILLRKAGKIVTVHSPRPRRLRRRASRPVSTMIRILKATSARRINEWRGTPRAPVWQKNTHEQTIRNLAELQSIREYIVNNPSRWQFDVYFSGDAAL